MNSPDGSDIFSLKLPPADITEAEREELHRWEAWVREQPSTVGAVICKIGWALVHLAYFGGSAVFLYLVVLQVISVAAQFSLLMGVVCTVLVALLPLYGGAKMVQWLSAKSKTSFNKPPAPFEQTVRPQFPDVQ